MPFAGRVMASATVGVRTANMPTGARAQVICHLEISTGSTTYRFMHNGGAWWQEVTNTATVPAVGVADVPAGTYDVRVWCRGESMGEIYVTHRELVVWAVAT